MLPSITQDPIVKRRVGRPSVAQSYARSVEELLLENPSMPGKEILWRISAMGYTGGKSALYRLLSRLRPATPGSWIHSFRGIAGAVSSHDFDAVPMHYADGTQESVRFFASRLESAGWIYVGLIQDLRAATLLRSFRASLEAFGGVPLVCAFYNSKNLIRRPFGPTLEWYPDLARVAIDLRFGLELYDLRHRSEKLARWVKKSFFHARSFRDRDDLEQSLFQWNHEVNSASTHVGGRTPLDLFHEERFRLRPLMNRS